MSLNRTLQEKYIENIITSHILATIYLKNGIRLKGRIIGHDKICVFLKAAETQMIHKHLINTISPEMSFERF